MSNLTLSVPLPSLATGSLDAYIQTVNRFPILSQQEETDLARRFRQAGDLEAARQLVVSHLRVVVAIARGYMAPAGVDLVCIPAFEDIQINGEDRTAIKFRVEPRALGRL